jgi:hypothetical protein
VQTLADGTHITEKSAVTRIFRDSLGRTRSEHPLAPNALRAGNIPESPTIVEINDPVASVKYVLDTVGKVAHRSQVTAPSGRAGQMQMPDFQAAPPAVSSGVAGGAGSAGEAAASTIKATQARPQVKPARPEVKNEILDPQTIEGVPAEGTRLTRTWPIDSVGNDRPISAVSEMWRSPELKVVLLQTQSDPRTGTSTRKLSNLSRTEPDASLFKPPADYAIVDETGDFDVKWGMQPTRD